MYMCLYCIHYTYMSINNYVYIIIEVYIQCIFVNTEKGNVIFARIPKQ